MAVKMFLHFSSASGNNFRTLEEELSIENGAKCKMSRTDSTLMILIFYNNEDGVSLSG